MPRKPTLKETIQAALAGYAHELVGVTSRNGENRTLRRIVASGIFISPHYQSWQRENLVAWNGPEKRDQ